MPEGLPYEQVFGEDVTLDAFLPPPVDAGCVSGYHVRPATLRGQTPATRSSATTWSRYATT